MAPSGKSSGVGSGELGISSPILCLAILGGPLPLALLRAILLLSLLVKIGNDHCDSCNGIQSFVTVTNTQGFPFVP